MVYSDATLTKAVAVLDAPPRTPLRMFDPDKATGDPRRLRDLRAGITSAVTEVCGKVVNISFRGKWYIAASSGDQFALYALASEIAHEDAHAAGCLGERGAYERQIEVFGKFVASGAVERERGERFLQELRILMSRYGGETGPGPLRETPMRRAVNPRNAAVAMGITTSPSFSAQTEPFPSAGVVNIESAFNVRLADTIEAGILRKGLVGAAQRLTGIECQTLLSEFRDERGRPLADVLADLAVDAPRYLTWLYFRDAPREYCDGGRLAMTHPGSRVVWVCGREFERSWHEKAANAEATLIHEMLHSLGLGENPPSSGAINRRVRHHCTIF
jgi:hypothetical protein